MKKKGALQIVHQRIPLANIGVSSHAIQRQHMRHYDSGKISLVNRGVFHNISRPPMVPKAIIPAVVEQKEVPVIHLRQRIGDNDVRMVKINQLRRMLYDDFSSALYNTFEIEDEPVKYHMNMYWPQILIDSMVHGDKNYTYRFIREALHDHPKSRTDYLNVGDDDATMANIYDHLEEVMFLDEAVQRRPDYKLAPFGENEVDIGWNANNIGSGKYQQIPHGIVFFDAGYIKTASTMYDEKRKEYVTIVTDAIDYPIEVLTYRSPDLANHRFYVKRLRNLAKDEDKCGGKPC